MTTYKRVELETDETPYGTRRCRVDEVEDGGIVHYEYSFWLVRPRDKGPARTYTTFFAGTVVPQKDYESLDMVTKEQLWAAVLELAGVKAKS